MKQSAISLHTKQALAASLKRSMKMKPLSRVTVSELCLNCGMNRKTFYYHFEDIYGLLKWTLEQETMEVMKQLDLVEDPEEIIRFVMTYASENNHILNCAYDAIGRDGMKRLFFSHFNRFINELIHDAEKELSLTLDSDYRQFLCQFYTNALSGMLIDRFQDKSAFPKEVITQYLLFTIRSSLLCVMKEYCKGL